MLNTDGTHDIIQELSKAASAREWIAIAWKLGIILIVIAYLKTILRTIGNVLNQIAYAIMGRDKKLNPKELMGATMWLTAVGIVVKYFYTSEINMPFFLSVLTYFCVMFGIDSFSNKGVKNISDNAK